MSPSCQNSSPVDQSSHPPRWARTGLWHSSRTVMTVLIFLIPGWLQRLQYTAPKCQPSSWKKTGTFSRTDFRGWVPSPVWVPLRSHVEKADVARPGDGLMGPSTCTARWLPLPLNHVLVLAEAKACCYFISDTHVLASASKELTSRTQSARSLT